MRRGGSHALQALAIVGVLAATPCLAHAAGPIRSLSEAQARFNAGDYYEAAALTEALLEDESIARADRAEALRLNGLASFFLDKRDDAEHSLLEFLFLEPDAHLDAALVPPEGIAFFEDVRSRHQKEINQHRKRPRWRDSALLSIVPLAGHIQNGEAGKGWAIFSTEVVLLATNVTTYVVLRDLCKQSDGTCNNEGTARALKTVNLVSGGLLIGTVLYGAWDGARGYRRRKAEFDADYIGVGMGDGRVSLTWSGTF
jgi:hypothetical protein